MFPAPTPKTATITSASPVSWSDGTLFDGFLLLGLGVPTDANGAWPQVAIGAGTYPPFRLPMWTMVPIAQGVFDQNTKVFLSSSIDPPGTKYGAYWYDINKRLVYPASGVAATGFTITTTPTYTINLPVLPLPTAAASIPLPQVLNTPSQPAVAVFSGSPLAITGSQNGVNTVFTLSATPQYLLLFRNQGLLDGGGVDYTLSGKTITFVLAPAADDVLQAYALGSVS